MSVTIFREKVRSRRCCQWNSYSSKQSIKKAI